MLSNYLKTALRTLRRRPGYAVINITGLAVGLAACILIALFVRSEWAADRFHEAADRIFRVTYEEVNTPAMRHLPTISPPMGPALADEYPEVETFLRLRDSDRHLLAVGERQFYESQFLYADSTFFDLFSFPLAQGNPATALDAPNSMVLTAATAQKYFGDADPMGQTMVFDGARRFTVTGVLASSSSRSHLDFDFLLSFSTFEVPRGYPVTLDSWHWISFYTYVRLRPDADPAALETKLPGFMARHFDEARARNVRLRLQPVTDIYLGTPKDPFFRSGNPAYLYGLSGIALLILLLAGANYTNLSVAQSLRRAREAGVRKALGARRADLAMQFLGEAVLLAGLALLLAGGLVKGALALFGEQLGGITLSTGEVLMGAPVLVGAVLLVGLVAGAYPALIASRFEPTRVLKGAIGGGVASGTEVRTTLVVVQFAIAIALIAGSLIVTRQMQFVRAKDLGFEHEQVVALNMQGEALRTRYPVLKERLQRNPNVLSVTQSGHLLDGVGGSVPIIPEGAGEDQDVRTMSIYGVHYDFFATLGIDVVSGRVFSEAFPADSAGGLMLNKAAARYFASTTPGWKDPIGKQLRVGDIVEGRVIGVTEDFHFASLHAAIQPLVMYVPPTVMEHMLVRVRPGNAAEVIDALRVDWADVAPDLPFDYTFLDDRIQQLYQEDRRFYRLVVTFAGLALLLACLGLYGLVAFMTQLRTKEVGIRKVLGASVSGLVALLAKPFLWHVVLAGMVACPVAYWAMQAWLTSFAYRVEIGAGVFALAAAATLIIALLTMSRHTLRVARIDPARTIRSE
jgi:putative ABC transport system permease protein